MEEIQGFWEFGRVSEFAYEGEEGYMAGVGEDDVCYGKEGGG